MEYPALKSRVKSHADTWAADAVLIEDKSSGQSLIQDLRNDKNFVFPVIAIEPIGDKITRMSVTSPIIESGRVSLPVRAEWLVDYEDEIFSFPNSSHFDQVDSTSQFLKWISGKAQSTRPRIRSL